MPVEMQGPEPAPETQEQRFYRRIEESGALPAGTSAQEGAVACFCEIFSRISRGEAEIFANGMPGGLGSALRGCASARPAHDPELFGREEYLRRVGARLGCEPGDAEPLARAVFEAMHAELPRMEIDDVESQLPPEIADVWRPTRGQAEA